MMIAPIIAYPHFRFDTVQMSARKEIKRADLHRKWQEDWAEYYRIKHQDLVQSKNKIKHYNFVKDIEAVNLYDNLRKNLNYFMYRYNTSLGTNLDVFI